MNSLTIMHIIRLMARYSDYRSLAMWLYLLGRSADNLMVVATDPKTVDEIGLRPDGDLTLYVPYPAYASGMGGHDASAFLPSGTLFVIAPPTSLRQICVALFEKLRSNQSIVLSAQIEKTIIQDLRSQCLGEDHYTPQGKLQSIGIHSLRFQAGQDQSTTAIIAGTYTAPYPTSRYYHCVSTDQLTRHLVAATQAMARLAQAELDDRGITDCTAADWLAAVPAEQTCSHVGSRVTLSADARRSLLDLAARTLRTQRVLDAQGRFEREAAEKISWMLLGCRQKMDAEITIQRGADFVRISIADKVVGNKQEHGTRRSIDVPAGNQLFDLFVEQPEQSPSDVSAADALAAFGYAAPGNTLRHAFRSYLFAAGCPGYAALAAMGHAGYGSSDRDYYACGVRRERDAIVLAHYDVAD